MLMKVRLQFAPLSETLLAVSVGAVPVMLSVEVSVRVCMGNPWGIVKVIESCSEHDQVPKNGSAGGLVDELESPLQAAQATILKRKPASVCLLMTRHLRHQGNNFSVYQRNAG